MGKILRVITAQEREQEKQQEAERQKARNELVRRLSTARPSQADINELVLMLAREHGLID
ncbi:MAG: hypothetical protein RQM92_00275 [Candidatus Syntrophopropionicum ammoniitolerans]